LMDKEEEGFVAVPHAEVTEGHIPQRKVSMWPPWHDPPADCHDIRSYFTRETKRASPSETTSALRHFERGIAQ
jgi:hypothetical protein